MTRTIDATGPVLVTGATGYIAGWIIKKLLDRGIHVHAAVRDPSNQAKIGHLKRMAGEAPGTLTLFQSDLLDPGSYAEAMRDCTVVFHTASPYTLTTKNPQRDLVDPALLGTENVLEQASKTPGIRRVVLTSSVAAIYGDNRDLCEVSDRTLREDQWNTTSTLDYNPYPYSKTVAERAAWRLAEAQDQWDLVVINPGLVMGPALNAKPTSDSFTVLGQFADGSMRLGVPDLQFGVVDVREVADGHIEAAFRPEAHGRYILCAEASGLMGLSDCLRERYGAYPLARFISPKPLIWVVGPLFSDELPRKFVTRNVGYPFKVDNTKSIKELGIQYRPIHESVNEAFAQMIETGRIKRR